VVRTGGSPVTALPLPPNSFDDDDDDDDDDVAAESLGAGAVGPARAVLKPPRLPFVPLGGPFVPLGGPLLALLNATPRVDGSVERLGGPDEGVVFV
jgi:hypothetical protein